MKFLLRKIFTTLFHESKIKECVIASFLGQFKKVDVHEKAQAMCKNFIQKPVFTFTFI